MSFRNTKPFLECVVTNNSDQTLLISNFSIKTNIGGVGERECLELIVPKKTGPNTSPINFNQIKEFISGDLSLISIKTIADNALTGLSTIVNREEKILNHYENYDIDITIDDRGNAYKLYLFKRTDAYNKELQNKEDIMIMYEAIAEQYESTIGL